MEESCWLITCNVWQYSFSESPCDHVWFETTWDKCLEDLRISGYHWISAITELSTSTEERTKIEMETPGTLHKVLERSNWPQRTGPNGRPWDLVKKVAGSSHSAILFASIWIRYDLVCELTEFAISFGYSHKKKDIQRKLVRTGRWCCGAIFSQRRPTEAKKKNFKSINRNHLLCYNLLWKKRVLCKARVNLQIVTQRFFGVSGGLDAFASAAYRRSLSASDGCGWLARTPGTTQWRLGPKRGKQNHHKFMVGLAPLFCY